VTALPHPEQTGWYGAPICHPRDKAEPVGHMKDRGPDSAIGSCTAFARSRRHNEHA
jgi:hypothetical protein